MPDFYDMYMQGDGSRIPWNQISDPALADLADHFRYPSGSAQRRNPQIPSFLQRHPTTPDEVMAEMERREAYDGLGRGSPAWVQSIQGNQQNIPGSPPRQPDLNEMDPGALSPPPPPPLADPNQQPVLSQPAATPPAAPNVAPQEPPQAPNVAPATPVAPPPTAPPGPPQEAPQRPSQEPAGPPAPSATPAPIQQALAPGRDPITEAVGGAETGRNPNVDPYTQSNVRPGGGSSGAYGRYQILPSTWADTKARFGLNAPWMPATIGELQRLSPEQQRIVQDRVFNEFLKPDYARALQAGGHDTQNPANYVATNLLGPTGGNRFLNVLRSQPGAPATAAASPSAIESNRNVFYDQTGRVRTVAEVYDELGRRAGVTGALSGAGQGQQQGPPQDQQQPPPDQQQAPQGAPQAQASTQPRDANPYRERLQALLGQIETKREGKPEWGELMFRMGTGLVGGRGWGDGLQKGGTLIADYLDKNRQNNQTTDQRLISGYGALSRERSAANAAKYGAPVNLTYMRNGQPQQIAAEVINGSPMVMQNGQLVPAHQVVGDNYQITGRNDTDGRGTRVWNGVPNALDETGGSRVNQDGTVTPVFRWNNNSEREHYGRASNMVNASVQLRNMEAQNYDPSRVEGAIAQATQNNPQGINLSTIIEQLGKATGKVTADDRIYATQLLRYMEGAGRLSSGAAITNTEWARFGSQFGGRANDPASVIRAIRMNRDAQAMGQASASGPAAPFLTDVLRGTHRMEPMIPLEGDSMPSQTGRSPRETAPAEPRTTRTASAQQGEPEAIRLTPAMTPDSLDDTKTYTNGRLTLTGAEWKRRMSQPRT